MKKKKLNHRFPEWTKSRLFKCKLKFRTSSQLLASTHFPEKNTKFVNIVFIFSHQEYGHEQLVKLLKKFSKFLLYFLFIYFIMAITYRHSAEWTRHCWRVAAMVRLFRQKCNSIRTVLELFTAAKHANKYTIDHIFILKYRRGHGFEFRSGLIFFSGFNFTTA